MRVELCNLKGRKKNLYLAIQFWFPWGLAVIYFLILDDNEINYFRDIQWRSLLKLARVGSITIKIALIEKGLYCSRPNIKLWILFLLLLSCSKWWICSSLWNLFLCYLKQSVRICPLVLTFYSIFIERYIFTVSFIIVIEFIYIQRIRK